VLAALPNKAKSKIQSVLSDFFAPPVDNDDDDDDDDDEFDLLHVPSSSSSSSSSSSCSWSEGDSARLKNISNHLSLEDAERLVRDLVSINDPDKDRQLNLLPSSLLRKVADRSQKSHIDLVVSTFFRSLADRLTSGSSDLVVLDQDGDHLAAGIIKFSFEPDLKEVQISIEIFAPDPNGSGDSSDAGANCQDHRAYTMLQNAAAALNKALSITLEEHGFLAADQKDKHGHNLRYSTSIVPDSAAFQRFDSGTALALYLAATYTEEHKGLVARAKADKNFPALVRSVLVEAIEVRENVFDLLREKLQGSYALVCPARCLRACM
jgi:hypothetical protein